MAQTSRLTNYRTTVTHENDVTAVTYVNTVVVRFTKSWIALNSDGWTTPTTKNNMNRASNQFGLGFSVFQSAFVWYVKKPNGTVVPFEDNMVFFRQ